jgi:HK97 family phage portal protein
MRLWKTLTGWLQKSAGPDWGTLERYLAWAFGSGASASGIIVNPQTALQAAAVYACVKVLAESVGMLPCNLYEETAQGAKRPATSHPLYPLLRDQPNEWQSSIEFMEMVVLHMCLRGNAYSYVNRSRAGDVVELLPLHPDMVRTQMGADFRLTYQVTMPDGGFKEFAPGELMHIRGLSINGWLGISPIAYARESIGLALATEKFGGQLFRNGAKVSGVLEHPGKLSDDASKRLRSTFDEAFSGENVHKTAILEEGLKYSKISMTGEDAQFLETRKYQRSEIAAIFRVPPHLIGDLENATFSNIEQQGLEFVNYSLMAWLVRIEKAIKRDLLRPDERKSLHVRFNVAALLRGDAMARSSYYHNGILDGWMTRNEAREAESDLGIVFNPLEGLDEPMMPLNMGEVGEETEQPGAGEGEGQGDGDDAGEGAGQPGGKRRGLAAVKGRGDVVHLADALSIDARLRTVERLLEASKAQRGDGASAGPQVVFSEGAVQVNLEQTLPAPVGTVTQVTARDADGRILAKRDRHIYGGNA